MAYDTQAIAASLTANIIASAAGTKGFSNLSIDELGEEVVRLFWKLNRIISISSLGANGIKPLSDVSTASPKAS